MGISHFCIFCQFSMLFNGNFAFLQFFMLFNGNMRIRSFGGRGGLTDVRTSGNSLLCPTGHRPFGAAAQKGVTDKEIDVKKDYGGIMGDKKTDRDRARADYG